MIHEGPSVSTVDHDDRGECVDRVQAMIISSDVDATTPSSLPLFITRDQTSMIHIPSSSSTLATDICQRIPFILTLFIGGGRKSLAGEATRFDSATPGSATARAIRDMTEASPFDHDDWLLH
jgi:hypothetical protein